MIQRLINIIFLYALGIAGVVGCFCGAEHHAMTAGGCLIFATRLLQDWIPEYKELRRNKGGLNLNQRPFFHHS